jgi:hypothetical protein
LKIYPRSYYINPEAAQGDLAYEDRKSERKLHRDDVGCVGCARYSQDFRVCGEGQKVNGSGKFCKWWWDLRTGIRAPEIKEK